MHLPLALTREEPQTLLALQLRGLVERLDIRGIRMVAPLPRSNLVVLVIAPEKDVTPPVRIVGREIRGVPWGRRRHRDGGDVVHYSSCVRRTHTHVREFDGDDARSGLVVFVET